MINNLKFPIECFQAQTAFALKLAAVKNIAIQKALLETSLVEEVTNLEWDEGQKSKIWIELTDPFNRSMDYLEIAQKLYTYYSRQDYALYQAVESKYKENLHGHLSYIYKHEQKQVRIHFIRGERSSPNPLKLEFHEARKNDFRELLLDIKAKHPDADTIKTSTWLHNIESYKNLFPTAMHDNLENVGIGSGLGIWGQFLRSDGSGNSDRLAQFLEKLATASSESEVKASVPYSVYKCVGKIGNCYEFYGV